MDDRLEELKKDYNNIPIPKELDYIVRKALKQKPRKRNRAKLTTGLAAAAVIFVGGLNVSPAFARSVAEVPGLENIVNVLTFTEYKVDEDTYQADIKVPAIDNLDNKELQATLNTKYLEESKALYKDFTKDMEELKKDGNDGHMGVDSGYEVKTDNEQILSIGRYVVNTVGSSSTTFQFDTIDKQKELLITLPSLFKNKAYVDVISEEIKKQMIAQMEKDPDDKDYWVKNPDNPENDPMDTFEKIKPEQSFYINKNHKLVIVFDKYEVAPGFMGVVEFTIPTKVMSDILVSKEYIK
ncbi:anti-sigma-V factor rsiV [Mesobacillus zeae]|uniref:Anti-sigma-V factor rsiV n=1 Tax=Mesobacillus zeae TaxID=1917180 RepID=A0A398BJ91_9BACI|nr:anti-sigma-V factor rsiV [Mesobacillus zeae]RID87516.1 anti-sigma-V factor rsiV [Mesobacillus zeae]